MQGLPKQMPGMMGMNADAIKKFNEALSSIQAKKINDEISEAILGKGRMIITQDVKSGLEYAKLKRETLTDNGLQFIRRAIQSGKYYYIVNHTANQFNQEVVLNTTSNAVYLLNPQTGTSGLANYSNDKNATRVSLQLAPGESIVVQTSNTPTNHPTPKYSYASSATDPIILNKGWTISFSNGGPMIPATQSMDHIQPWTSLKGDSALYSFSGTGTYATRFQLANKFADDYVLSLDKVYESAKVIVNGKEAGLIWSIPFQLHIGKYLRQGENEIRLEVNNLMANRIAYMDRNHIEWRKYHEINFVNIDYKRFDASNWKTQVSGLDGNVVITPVMYKK
jgi:hypothetical protein